MTKAAEPGVGSEPGPPTRPAGPAELLGGPCRGHTDSPLTGLPPALGHPRGGGPWGPQQPLRLRRSHPGP